MYGYGTSYTTPFNVERTDATHNVKFIYVYSTFMWVYMFGWIIFKFKVTLWCEIRSSSSIVLFCYICMFVHIMCGLNANLHNFFQWYSSCILKYNRFSIFSKEFQWIFSLWKIALLKTLSYYDFWLTNLNSLSFWLFYL